MPCNLCVAGTDSRLRARVRPSPAPNRRTDRADGREREQKLAGAEDNSPAECRTPRTRPAARRTSVRQPICSSSSRPRLYGRPYIGNPRGSSILLVAPMQFDELCQVVRNWFRKNGPVEHPQLLVEPTIEGRRRPTGFRWPHPAHHGSETGRTACLAVIALGSAHGRSVKKPRMNAAGAAHDQRLFHMRFYLFSRTTTRRAIVGSEKSPDGI